MRRLMLIILMFVLPLQWSWAAAASVCEHELEAPGMHASQHQHDAAEPLPEQQQPGDQTLCCDINCGACHGMVTPFGPADSPLVVSLVAQRCFTPYQASIPDRSPDTLLRPPLSFAS